MKRKKEASKLEPNMQENAELRRLNEMVTMAKVHFANIVTEGDYRKAMARARVSDTVKDHANYKVILDKKYGKVGKEN